MFKLLALAGIGAGAAYLLDKEKGAERREQLRYKADGFLRKMDQETSVDAEDSSSPVNGVIRGARTLISKAQTQTQTKY